MSGNKTFGNEELIWLCFYPYNNLLTSINLFLAYIFIHSSWAELEKLQNLDHPCRFAGPLFFSVNLFRKTSAPDIYSTMKGFIITSLDLSLCTFTL